MRANLYNAVVPPGRLDHRPAFHDRHRERLLDINVLAGFASRDRLDRMPVIRRGNHNGIHVFPVQHRAEVFHACHVLGQFRHLCDTLAQPRKPRVQPVVVTAQIRLVHVADDNDLRIRMRQESTQELAPAITHADEPQPNLIVRQEHPLRCSTRRSRSRESALGKQPAIDALRHGQSSLSALNVKSHQDSPRPRNLRHPPHCVHQTANQP